jgi:hypothetical protein
VVLAHENRGNQAHLPWRSSHIRARRAAADDAHLVYDNLLRVVVGATPRPWIRIVGGPRTASPPRGR